MTNVANRIDSRLTQKGVPVTEVKERGDRRFLLTIDEAGHEATVRRTFGSSYRIQTNSPFLFVLVHKGSAASFDA